MKRTELEEQIISVCKDSGLTPREILTALSRARQRLEKGITEVSVSAPLKKDYKPLSRPGGKFMGKQRSQPKEKE